MTNKNSIKLLLKKKIDNLVKEFNSISNSQTLSQHSE